MNRCVPARPPNLCRPYVPHESLQTSAAQGTQRRTQGNRGNNNHSSINTKNDDSSVGSMKIEVENQAATIAFSRTNFENSTATSNFLNRLESIIDGDGTNAWISVGGAFGTLCDCGNVDNKVDRSGHGSVEERALGARRKR